MTIGGALAVGLVALAAVGCGDEDLAPEVNEAFIVGITPHDDFRQSGLVDFSILPKDAVGQAIIDSGLVVRVGVGQPAGLTASTQTTRTRSPQAGQGLAAALNLDSSGSMGSNDPQMLRKEAARQFIDQLASGDPVAVFDFGAGDTSPFEDTRLLSDFTTDHAQAKQAVDQVKASGGTPMYASIVEVLDFFDKAFAAGSRNRALLVLGDGKPSSKSSLDEACKAAKRTGIPINTVGFGPAADSSPKADSKAVQVLRALASCSGGAYAGVVEATGLNDTFNKLGQASKSGSVVVTARFSPVPDQGASVGGALDIGNGAQQGVSVRYSFVAP